MENDRFTPISPTILPKCGCCYPTQNLVVNGRRAYCPLTEKIYEDAGDGTYVRFASPDVQVRTPPVWQGEDFYPGRNRRRGETAPVLINPAEERFGRE